MPEQLDVRRRRILFRAWHRGMRELDLIMGRFADRRLTSLSDSELDDLEHLMDVPDRDVLAWLTGEFATPHNYDTPVFRKLKAFHSHARPLHA